MRDLNDLPNANGILLSEAIALIEDESAGPVLDRRAHRARDRVLSALVAVGDCSILAALTKGRIDGQEFAVVETIWRNNRIAYLRSQLTSA